MPPRPTAALLAGLDSVPVPRDRPVFHPELGKFFENLREARGWTLRGTASIAHRRGIRISYQVLFRLEAGQVKNPEPAVLKAVADLYELEYSDLVSRFVGVRYGSVVTSPVTRSDQRSGAPSGGRPDASSDRARLLEVELTALRAQYRDVSNAARAAFKQLGKVANHIGQGQVTPRATARRGGAHRRAAR